MSDSVVTVAVGACVRNESVVVVVGWVGVECVPVGLEVDDSLAVTHDGAMHVPAGRQLHGKLVHACLDVEVLRDAVGCGKGNGCRRGGENDGPKRVLELHEDIGQHAPQSSNVEELTMSKLSGFPTPSGALASLGWGRAHM